MRKFLSGAVNIASLLIFAWGCVFFFRVFEAYYRADSFMRRAAFNSGCSSPSESDGCANLYADVPIWPNGVEITDKDVLIAYASMWMDAGAGALAAGAFLSGTAGVLLAASVIVRGQAKTRQEVHDALKARESPG